MGGLTASIAEAKAKADPMTVARFARLSPEWGAGGSAKFLCPIQADGKSWANFFRKTEGKHVGHLAFGCATCAAEARQTGKRMPDSMAALMHVLKCSLPAALAWLQEVNAGREPTPPPATNKPATAPKIESWESPIKGTALGLGVIFARPGARAESLHFALCKDDWAFIEGYYDDLSAAAIVAVDDPAGWVGLKSLIPAKTTGVIYYRGEPTTHHLDFVDYLATKGCTYELVDLDQEVAKDQAEADEDEDAGEDSERTPGRAENEDVALKMLARTPELVPQPPAGTPGVPPLPGATTRTTPVDQGRSPASTPVDRGSPSTTTPTGSPAPFRADGPPPAVPVFAPTDSPKADALLARRLVETPGKAREFLAALLAAGPRPGQEVVRLGRAQHLGRGAIHHAKAELGILSEGRDCIWRMP